MLNLEGLQSQIRNMVSETKQSTKDVTHAVTVALEKLSAARTWQALAETLDSTKTSWNYATLTGHPLTVYAASPRPPIVTVCASDGSQVMPDRNFSLGFYLINTSEIVFHYGTDEKCVMRSEPKLFYGEKEMSFKLDGRQAAITGDIVSAKRDQAELETLLAISLAAKKENRPIVAIADGTLIKWSLAAIKSESFERDLAEQFAHTLSQFRENEIPICSYISSPSSSDVIKSTRIAVFGETERDDEIGDAASGLAGVTDVQLFKQLLKSGERSAVFGSTSSVLKNYGEDEKIQFCYLQTGEAELARLEFPAWVAKRKATLDLVQSVVLDNVKKGFGYPVILSEAHEAAVVKAAEKQLLMSLIEDAALQLGVRFSYSEKSLSKRVPRI